MALPPEVLVAASRMRSPSSRDSYLDQLTYQQASEQHWAKANPTYYTNPSGAPIDGPAAMGIGVATPSIPAYAAPVAGGSSRRGVPAYAQQDVSAEGVLADPASYQRTPILASANPVQIGVEGYNGGAVETVNVPSYTRVMKPEAQGVLDRIKAMQAANQRPVTDTPEAKLERTKLTGENRIKESAAGNPALTFEQIQSIVGGGTAPTPQPSPAGQGQPTQPPAQPAAPQRTVTVTAGGRQAQMTEEDYAAYQSGTMAVRQQLRQKYGL